MTTPKGIARAETAVVAHYLSTLAAPKRRGRPIDYDKAKRRMEAIEAALAKPQDPMTRLGLIQDRMDLQDKIDGEPTPTKYDGPEPVEAFIRVAASYSRRKGISMAAWREVGVPADVLHRAFNGSAQAPG